MQWRFMNVFYTFPNTVLSLVINSLLPVHKFWLATGTAHFSSYLQDHQTRMYIIFLCLHEATDPYYSNPLFFTDNLRLGGHHPGAAHQFPLSQHPGGSGGGYFMSIDEATASELKHRVRQYSPSPPATPQMNYTVSRITVSFSGVIWQRYLNALMLLISLNWV